MDDQKLREISERLDYLRGLDKRREQIAASIAEQGKMTAELEKKLSAAATLSELEDIYRPYKQKRRTRAMIAKEKGVQPLADLIFAQRRGDDPLALAQAYVSEEKGVPDAETAVQLAQDILAEQISDDAAIRANLRALYRRTACCVPSPPKRAKAFTRSMRITANRFCARRDTAFWPLTAANAKNG